MSYVVIVDTQCDHHMWRELERDDASDALRSARNRNMNKIWYEIFIEPFSMRLQCVLYAHKIGKCYRWFDGCHEYCVYVLRCAYSHPNTHTNTHGFGKKGSNRAREFDITCRLLLFWLRVASCPDRFVDACTQSVERRKRRKVIWLRN